MKTLLVDINFLCHRSAYTMGDLSTDEMSTGVIFGVLNQIKKIAKELESNKFVFFWDSKNSIRKKIFPEYKLKRKKSHEIDIFKQFRILRDEVLPAIGFNNNYYQDGYEADDLIAKAVIQKDGFLNNIIIISPDQDLYQLLNYADMFSPVSKRVITKEFFKEKYKIDPSWWYEVKAIAGCSTDSVPGVKGVGEKTAIKFLTSELKATTKAFQEIIQSRNLIDRNRRLVLLPLKGTKKFPLVPDNLNSDGFIDVCSKYQFDSLLRKNELNWWKSFFRWGE